MPIVEATLVGTTRRLRRFAIRRLPDEQEADMSRRCGLLRVSRGWPSEGGATEQGNEEAPLHAALS